MARPRNRIVNLGILWGDIILHHPPEFSSTRNFRIIITQTDAVASIHNASRTHRQRQTTKKIHYYSPSSRERTKKVSKSWGEAKKSSSDHL